MSVKKVRLMNDKITVPPLIDQTDKEAEMYRDMVIQLADQIELLKRQLKEETDARYAAYARIKELTDK